MKLLPVYRYKTVAGGFTQRGFIVNEAELEGSVLLLPRSAFLWKPKTFEEVTPESLSLVPLLDPSIEILLIGSGDHQRRPSEALAAHFRNLGIVVGCSSVLALCFSSTIGPRIYLANRLFSVCFANRVTSR